MGGQRVLKHWNSICFTIVQGFSPFKENVDKIVKNNNQNDTKIDPEIKKMPRGLAKLAQGVHCD